MAGIGRCVGQIDNDAGRGSEQVGARANHRHRHRAAIGNAGDIDVPGIGSAVGNEFFNQPDDEGDVVGTLRRRAAGAIGVGTEIGPGAAEPIRKDHTEAVAPGDFRP